jgi:hypothetical protein
MLDLHGISRESFDLIVDEEVSGQETYEKKYVHPEKPGGQSGVTIGIGYDCGYYSPATIRNDWEGKIPHTMVEALATQAAGLKGDAALAPCNRLRGLVTVPWDAAIDVFSNVSIPKYMAATSRGLPNYDDLPPDCKGALLSLVYNRGASFQQAGDRYSEMRAIRAAMIAGKLNSIPGLFRSMARLWTAKSVRGVALRREHEARLFEQGLKTIASPLADIPDVDEDDAATKPFQDEDNANVRAIEDGTADNPVNDVDPQALPPFLRKKPTAPGRLNIQPHQGRYDVSVEVVQRELDAMGYHEVGDIDGLWGGKTAAAIKAFFTDRGTMQQSGLPAVAEMGQTLNDEISKAKAEGFSRPIDPSRANAKPADIAPKNEVVRVSLWSKLYAKIATGAAALGIGGSSVSQIYSSAQGAISPVRQALKDVPPELWLGILGLVSLLVWYATSRTANAATKDYNTGRTN